jgi:hypothetical protein
MGKDQIQGGLTAKTKDGNEVRLVLDINAICDIEDRLNSEVYAGFRKSKIRPATIQDLLDLVAANPPAKLVRLLIWGAMLAESPEATERDAGALMNDLEDSNEVVRSAVLAAFPDAADTPEGEGGKEGK